MNMIELPTGIAIGARTGHLAVATFCTINIDAYIRFYGSTMEMHMEGPIAQSDGDKNEQRRFWKIPLDLDFDLYHCYRRAVPSLVHLRILHLKSSTPHIHKSYNSYELGSFSLGFPTSDAKRFDARLLSAGVEAMAPMQVGDIIRADGIPGQYIETIYKGPDYLHCVGIERIKISQLAPCDPDSEFCGPGYSAFVVKNADREIDFYTKVLDFYTLYDQVWKTSAGSALGIKEGVPYRFTGYYAQGASQNYLISLEYQDGNAIDTGVPSHVPNQGLGMYSFFCTSVDDIVARAVSHDISVISPPKAVSDPIMGKGKACILQAPSGIYVELFER